MHFLSTDSLGVSLPVFFSLSLSYSQRKTAGCEATLLDCGATTSDDERTWTLSLGKEFIGPGMVNRETEEGCHGCVPNIWGTFCFKKREQNFGPSVVEQAPTLSRQGNWVKRASKCFLCPFWPPFSLGEHSNQECPGRPDVIGCCS